MVKYSTMLVSIIIPVYNEKETLADLLPRVINAEIPGGKREIIAVDDGSTDGSSELLDAYSDNSDIKVIRLSENSGKASAIKAGLGVSNGDFILIQDADLEYSPDDYKNLLSPFVDVNIHAVYGSRFIRKAWPEGMKVQHWIANRTFTFLTNLLYGARITDEGTGYKAFRAETLKSLNIKSTGFEFCPEVTAKLLKKGVKITEVPVSYKARTRKEGKKPGVLDGLKVMWTIIKCRVLR